MDHEAGAAGQDVDLHTLYEAHRAAIDAKMPKRETPSQGELQWCLVYTAPLQERLAEHWLKEAKFEVFIPLWTFRRRLRGKTVEKEVPLFRNYVFVGEHVACSRCGRGRPPFCEDVGLRFGEIEETKGVLEIVRFDGIPVTIPATVIGDLMLACELKCFVLDERTGWARRVKPGTPKEALARFRVEEWVRVIEGPLQGLTAQIIAPPKGEHVRVMTSLFGCATPTALRLETIELLT